jgi:hypothetical protein
MTLLTTKEPSFRGGHYQLNFGGRVKVCVRVCVGAA